LGGSYSSPWQVEELQVNALFLALICLTTIGLLLTTLQVILTISKLRRAQGSAKSASQSCADEPLVSILKPVCGLEDELEQNLSSFAHLTGVAYEVIISVADTDDPALEIVRSVMHKFPGSPFKLVVGGHRCQPGANQKIERLLAAIEHARGELIFISDSNVRLSPGDLAVTVRHFDEPGVGCVSNLFVGAGARSIGARIDSLHLLTFVAPGCVLADAFGIPCVVGKSMAITRGAYSAIGGFEAFADRLGEDQAMGDAVKAAGFRVVLSPRVVRNVIVERPIRAALARQIRWGKIRYAFSRLTYVSEFLVTPLPGSLLASIVGIIQGEVWFSLAMPGLVLGVRMIQTKLLARFTAADLWWRDLLLLPIKDILQFGTQFVPFFSREVSWRGLRTRLGRGTRMLPVGT
jgi:ceramide glucosyltransferase